MLKKFLMVAVFGLFTQIAFSAEQFDEVVERLKTCKTAGQEDQLYFYARYKQANTGACNQAEPSRFNVKAHAKWKAWKALGNMPSDEAKRQYVRKAKELYPAIAVEFGN